MKRFFLLAALGFTSLVFIRGNCNKTDVTTCTPVEPAAEEATIVAYNAASMFTAVKHSSGLYYQILDPGTGATATATSNVRAQYTGKLFDGKQFDANNDPGGATFNLSGVIQGWTIGIPLIKSGGKIRLMIPSKYAYGCTGSGSRIPANAPLFFEITLLAVF